MSECCERPVAHAHVLPPLLPRLRESYYARSDAPASLPSPRAPAVCVLVCVVCVYVFVCAWSLSAFGAQACAKMGGPPIHHHNCSRPSPAAPMHAGGGAHVAWRPCPLGVHRPPHPPATYTRTHKALGLWSSVRGTKGVRAAERKRRRRRPPHHHIHTHQATTSERALHRGAWE